MKKSEPLVRVVSRFAVCIDGIRYNVDHIPEAHEGARLTLTPTCSGYSVATPDNKVYALTQAHLRIATPL